MQKYKIATHDTEDSIKNINKIEIRAAASQELIALHGTINYSLSMYVNQQLGSSLHNVILSNTIAVILM